MILENCDIEKGQNVRYPDIWKSIQPYAAAGAFENCKDKYGDGKSDKTLEDYIRHMFQGLVHNEDQKAQNDSLIQTTEKNGNYKYYGKEKSGIRMVSEGIIEYSIEAKIDDLVTNNIKQIILTGAPGTGKTYAAKNFVLNYIDEDNNIEAGEIDREKYKLIQFHSSYDYTDFVEGLRPVQTDHGIQFVKLDGHFKKFCRKITEANYSNKDNKKMKYFFIIDEINRADLSKVFGELMFSLEESYRGEDNRIITQYSNLPTYEIVDGCVKLMEHDVFMNGFFIPENVYIIGTMNDIDRSVEAFDFALRRRFQWVEIMADNVMMSVLTSMKEKGSINKEINIDKLARSAGALNKIIEDEGKKFGLSNAYHIGPAYLMTKESDINEAKEEIWKYRIEPLIREYCRGYNNVDSFIESCYNAFTNTGNGQD